MVAFTTFIPTVLALAATGATAFKTACNAPYDQCGFTLANQVYGYSYDELKAAHGGVDDGTLYNAVYNCHEGGVIEYNRACPRGCDAFATKNANCNA